MAMGDIYECYECHNIYRALCALDTKQCKRGTCLSADVHLYKGTDVVPGKNVNEQLKVKEEKEHHEAMIAFKEATKEDEEPSGLIFSEVSEVSNDEEKQQKTFSGGAVFDPEDEFMAILKDLGLKNKIKSITAMFYGGDIDSPAWMNRCLKLAGVDKAKRRLAIATKFGKVPPSLGLADDEDDEDDEMAEKPKKDKDASPIKLALNQVKQQKADELLNVAAEAEIAKYQAQIDAAKNVKQGVASGSDVLPIPVTDDKGAPMIDAKTGKVVTMEVPRGEAMFYFMNQKRGGNSGEGSFMEKFMLMQQDQMNKMQLLLADSAKKGNDDPKRDAEMKYWQQKSDDERKRNDEYIKNLQAEREKTMATLYDVREKHLTEKLEENTKTIQYYASRGPEQFLEELMSKIKLGERMGLTSTDAVKTRGKIQADVAGTITDEGKEAAKEVRGIAKGLATEILDAIREERKKNGKKGVEIEPTEEEKQLLYHKLVDKIEAEKDNLIKQKNALDAQRAELDAEIKKRSNVVSQQAAKPEQIPPTPEPPKSNPAEGIGMVPDEPKKEEPKPEPKPEPKKEPKMESPKVETTATLDGKPIEGEGNVGEH